MSCRPHEHSTDEGFTLIEVLITVVVVGIGVVGLIFGIITVASGSTTSQKYADQRAQLAVAAELIQAAPYQTASASGACDTAPKNAYVVAIAAGTAPKNASGVANVGPTAVVKRIDYWTGNGFVSDATGYNDADGVHHEGCYYDRQTGSSHMQRITLGFASGSAEQLTFVKRQP